MLKMCKYSNHKGYYFLVSYQISSFHLKNYLLYTYGVPSGVFTVTKTLGVVQVLSHSGEAGLLR